MEAALKKIDNPYARQRDQFAGCILESLKGYFDIIAIHIGTRLGFYHVLDRNGSLASPELATLTGTDERYVREWLEQQTVAGSREGRHSIRMDQCRPLVLAEPRQPIAWATHRDSRLNWERI